jgi:hypothetical protein
MFLGNYDFTPPGLAPAADRKNCLAFAYGLCYCRSARFNTEFYSFHAGSREKFSARPASADSRRIVSFPPFRKPRGHSGRSPVDPKSADGNRRSAWERASETDGLARTDEIRHQIGSSGNFNLKGGWFSMKTLIGGAVAAVLGVIGLAVWFPAFLQILAGSVPIMLLLGGGLALYLGFDELKDSWKKEKEEVESQPADETDKYKQEINDLKKEIESLKKA